MSPGDIAEELGMKTNTVRQALIRARDRDLVVVNSAGQYKKKDDVTE